MMNFDKGPLIGDLTDWLGLKDHVVSEKRLSTAAAGGATVPLSKLQKRRQQDEDLIEPQNYLHPKMPSSRMGRSIVFAVDISD